MMRTNYWSCTNFANKLRGVQKPSALSLEEWDEWKKNAKKNHPIRFWLAEEGLNKLQNFVMWPRDKFYNIKYYVVNRWIDQSNALVAHPANIKPGGYMDLSGRIFVCLFDELVDFVEIEKAYCNVRWDSASYSNKKWWQAGPWRTRTWRSPEEGVAHLNWEISLRDDVYDEDGSVIGQKPSQQSLDAQEILDLYNWYTVTRKSREDPMDVSGWSEYCDYNRDRGIEFFSPDRYDEVYTHERVSKIHKTMNKIEQEYEDEDTEMLIRLIKIRKTLWT